MLQQARFSAQLLAGQMPPDIEEVFKKAGIPLFPTSKKDFEADCSCPDGANPCKHIAAVYYIVGEAFDRDPFLIFHLRGLRKDGLLEALHQEGGIVQKDIELEEVGEEAIEPLANDPVVFWEKDKEIDYHFSLKPPPLNAAILHRLGVPQFWMGTEKEFYKTMEKVYSHISKSALEIAYSSSTTTGPGSGPPGS
jgi:uncharacterized Zn finger protein